MKTTTLLALIICTIQAQFTGEIIRGVQTGIFIPDEESLKHYDCPEVTMSKQANAFLGLIKAVENFVMVMAEDEPGEIWDCKECEENFNHIALMVSLIVSYNGCEFCQGVLIAF